MKFKKRIRNRFITMPPKSIYWQYFEKIDNANAKCRSCGKVLKTSGNTTNLQCHMHKKHANLITKKGHSSSQSLEICKETPVAVPSTNFTSVVSDLWSDCESEKSDASARTKLFQPTVSSSFQNIAAYAETGSKGVQLSNAILYMICKDSQPFQIVENEGFLNLMKVTAPLYKVLSRFTFKRMLENKYNVIKEHFKDTIQEINSITLTTDIWTDTMQTRSFLGVTALFSQGDEMESVTLGIYDLTESHTAEYIANMLIKTCKEWNIDNSKILAVVTDAAANIVKAVEIAFGKKCHIHCFAHMLNLVVQKSIENTPNLPGLIAAVKKIVTWFKQSVAASDELRQESDLKLIQDVATRWNSTFYMIERFLKLRPIINTIINCHTSAPAMLNAKDIMDLTEVCDILRPIEITTREICGEKYVTCSKVIFLTRLLYSRITGLQPKQIIADDLKNNVIAQIKKRLLQTENVTTLAIATLMDPRFKNIHFQDALACSRAIRAVKDLLSVIETQSNSEKEQSLDKECARIENTEDIWSDHYKLVNEKNNIMNIQSDTNMPSELSYYLKSPLAELKQNPLVLWNHVLGSTYPMLQKIAIKHLSSTATSTASERLFSKAGQNLYQQRNRLKGKLLSKILFLQNINKKFWDL